MAAMGPPGGGRTVISSRLQSRFNVINMTFPTVRATGTSRGETVEGKAVCVLENEGQIKEGDWGPLEQNRI